MTRFGELVVGESADGTRPNLRHCHIVEDAAERTRGKNIDILRMDRLRCHGLGREAGDDVADRFVLHLCDHEFGARFVWLARAKTKSQFSARMTASAGPTPTSIAVQ